MRQPASACIFCAIVKLCHKRVPAPGADRQSGIKKISPQADLPLQPTKFCARGTAYRSPNGPAFAEHFARHVQDYLTLTTRTRDDLRPGLLGNT